MSGRMARNKGRQGEYLVRDFFRERGWTSNRVVGSGAHFKIDASLTGDVVLKKDSIELKAEVKFKKDEYKSLYAMLDQKGEAVRFATGGHYVIMSYSFDDLGFEGSPIKVFDGTVADRTIRKICNMRKLLKGADFLVVKINNKPLIFLRYFGSGL